MAIDDRRRYLRKKKQSIVSFYVIEEDGEKTVRQAQVIDGSCGGLRLQINESLPKNTRLYIRLDSDDWGEELTYLCNTNGRELVEIIGSVMWCLEDESTPGDYEIGTRFVGRVEQ